MQYIAFLRAVNVGGRTVKMGVLREQFKALGYTDVDTYIASGNVIFRSPHDNVPQLETEIEQQLQEAFDFEVTTIIRTAAELQQLVTENPFSPYPNEKTSRYISFLKTEPAAAHAAQLPPLSTEIDNLMLDGRHLHWLYRRDRGRSKLTNNKIERVLKVAATRRNVNTVQKIVKKYFSE